MLLRIQAKLSSAYSWLSLLSAFCHSQAPFDRHFQRLRDLDLSTPFVLSVNLIPACFRKANTMQIMHLVFISSCTAMDLHNLWSKSSRGHVVVGKKVGPTAFSLSSWLGYKLEDELGCPCTLLISATLRFIQFWRHCSCELGIWLPSLQIVLCCGGPEGDTVTHSAMVRPTWIIRNAFSFRPVLDAKPILVLLQSFLKELH